LGERVSREREQVFMFPRQQLSAGNNMLWTGNNKTGS